MESRTLRNLLWLGAGWLLSTVTVLLILRYASGIFIADIASIQLATPTPTAETTEAASFVPQITPAAAVPSPIHLPATCGEFKKQNPGVGDGEYTLYLHQNEAYPVLIYCHNMATDNPTEYLSLVNAGDAANFSSIVYPTQESRTIFSRLRIDLDDLTINRNDTTFATTTGIVPVEENAIRDYATAMGCQQTLDTPVSGQANIDLTGTSFILADTVQFVVQGQDAAGEAIISPDRRTAALSVSGRCGWIWPQGEIKLVLKKEAE